MIQCEHCLGTGLIGGNPDKPHEHVGALSTCPKCNGTGKVLEGEPAPDAAAQDSADATIHNPDEAPVKAGGILGMLGIRK